MNVKSVYYNYVNPTENLFKFSLQMSSLHSHTPAVDVIAALFTEFPDLQVHYDPIFGSLYITDTCRLPLLLCPQRFCSPSFPPIV